jgi:hypothetical protein
MSKKLNTVWADLCTCSIWYAQHKINPSGEGTAFEISTFTRCEMKLKTVLTFTILILSVATTYASVDCEDIVNLSQESTQLSQQIFNYDQTRQRLHAQVTDINAVIDHAQELTDQDQKTLQLARGIISEISESYNIVSIEQIDSDFVRISAEIQNINSTADENSEITRLKQGDLQKLNHVRMDLMKQIRDFRRECF